jgi:2,4-dienoyl-CoA reductase-like NADH-dependent reductase (Old Yellow Enzyme family)/NADPH-dependent 2,4-dienoyl-CoA reductase/sulfur reductase-like enzyme
MKNAFETFPNLLAPVKVGNVMFRNRMFCAPTGHTDIAPGGQPSIEAIMYFERKAMGGIATVTCGEVNVDPDEFNESRWPRDIVRGSNYNYPRLASMVARHGAVPCVELQFFGVMARARGPKRSDPAWGPVDMVLPGGQKVRAMTEERFQEVIEGFGKAALSAKNHGFGMVTLHGAHGWGLQQFMSPHMNTRTDRWGGSAENRCRFAVMAIDEIHRVCGAGFPVEIRISGSEIDADGYGVDEACRIAEQLDGHADIIHVSVGGLNHSKESFARTHVSMFYPQGRNVEYAAEIKKHVRKSLVGTVGGLSDPYYMEEVLASGKADIVYMARELICDPDMPNKVRHGQAEDVRKCMRCLSCFSACMHKGDFFCAINPETSRERENYYALPATRQQKVLVVGGGIAGMEAALTAARNGHEVTLCEKSGELGGGILCERSVPFKQRLHEYIERQKQLVADAGIALRLNTEVTPEYARNQGFDVVIAAIGADPITPAIPGVGGSNVVQAMDVFKNPDLAKGKIVILGAGFVGTELAIYLKDLKNAGAEIVEMLDTISDGGNSHHRMAVEDMIIQKKIPIHFNTKAVEITSKGVKCQGPEGEAFFEADTVILAAGMRARQDEAASFNACAPTFHMVGDCRQAANIIGATSTAYTTAKYIGRYDPV